MELQQGMYLRAHAIYGDFFKCENRKKNADFLNMFLIYAQNTDLGYTLEPPRQGGSNEYPQSMFWSINKKNGYTPSK